MQQQLEAELLLLHLLLRPLWLAEGLGAGHMQVRCWPQRLLEAPAQEVEQSWLGCPLLQHGCGFDC